jgi:hypothetical protein
MFAANQQNAKHTGNRWEKKQGGFAKNRPVTMPSDRGTKPRDRVGGKSGVSVDVANDITHGEQFFCCFIGHFDAEFFFKRHHELNGIERVGTEVFDEFGVGGHKISAHAELLHNDIFYTIFGTLV